MYITGRTLIDWLSKSEQSSVGVDIAAVKYAPVAFQNFDSKLLGLSFTDGSFLFITAGKNVNSTIPLPLSPTLSTKLCGMNHILSLNDSVSSFSHGKPNQIHCFEYYTLKQIDEILQNICVMLTSSSENVSLWVLRVKEVDSNCRFVIEPVASCSFAESSDGISHFPPRISCFSNADSFFPVDMQSNIAKQVIAAGTTSGSIYIFEAVLSVPHIEEGSSSLKLLCSAKVNSQSVISILFCKEVYLVLSGESLILCSLEVETDASGADCWTLAILDRLTVSSHLITGITLIDESFLTNTPSSLFHDISGCGKGSQNDVKIPFLISSYGGELILTYLLISDSSGSNGKKFFKLLRGNESTMIPTKEKCHLGVCVDPLSLAIAYVHKIEAAAENSRDVQLNSSLGKARSGLTWMTVPFIAKGWAFDDAAVCELFSLTVSNPHLGTVSIASLPVIYLQCLETYLAENKMNLIAPRSQFKPSISSPNPNSSTSKRKDDESDAEDMREDASDDDSQQPKSKKKSGGGSSGGGGAGTKEKRSRASIRVIYNKIKEQLGPDIKSLTSSEAYRLIKCAAVIALKINELQDFSFASYASFFDSVNISSVEQMSFEAELELILSFPSNEAALDVKMRLWITLHLLLLAPHHIRNSIISSDISNFLDDIKKVLRVAYAFKTLKRFAFLLL